MGSKPSSQATEPDSPPKKSLYRHYEDAKSGRNKPISADDMQRHTGMTPEELSKWSQNREGVAGYQNAGSITAGPATGLGGLAAGSGYGGWGPGASSSLKSPPKEQQGPVTNE